MRTLTRRSMLKRTTLTALAFSAPGTLWAGVPGADETIRVAVVGLRKKGKEHVEVFRKLPGVRVAALCDCDTEFIDEEAAKFHARQEKVKTCVDYRELLDDPAIDAVVLAVPDHWHALMTVWACQAGKDVYVEKPASHDIWEGRQMLTAARKYGRIVQVGSQNRSDIGLRKAVPYLQEGHLGRMLWAHGCHSGQRRSIGRVSGPQPIPATVEYDLFQGPASLTPLMREQLHYDWHWLWDTGTGEMGNIGAHQVDHNRWALGQNTLPPRVISFGGRFGYDDDGETPNTQFALFDYQPAPLLYEIRGIPRQPGTRQLDAYRGEQASLRIECEHGYFAGGRGGGAAYDKQGNRIKDFKGDSGAQHQANFIDAMRSRRQDLLHAPLADGHLSATLCHMANISFRLGRRESVDAIRKAVQGRGVLEELVDRCVEHLRANGVDLERQPLVLGAEVSLNPDTEQFTGPHADWANMFLKRNYREPYVVPEKV